MTGAEIIDTVMSYTYNITPNDPGNAARRLRVLNYLQDTFDEVWMMREWAFSFKDTTVNIDGASGVAAVPDDYLELGVQGGVYNAQGDKLRETPFVYIKQLILNGNSQSPPELFAIVSNGAALEIHTPIIGSDYTVNLQYRYQPVTLTDDTAEPPIPRAHHNSVLVAGTAAKAARSLGDPRPDDEQSYKQAINRMIVVERSRKTSIQKLPRAMSGMW